MVLMSLDYINILIVLRKKKYFKKNVLTTQKVKRHIATEPTYNVSILRLLFSISSANCSSLKIYIFRRMLGIHI
jgi:secreted Zn-dependent insulinase-like peptidase